MEAHVRAGIDIQGAVLRYAEVEQYGPRYRLLRLGSCDFDFDVAHAVLHEPDSAHLQTLMRALADVYEGAVATSLKVALHPPHGHSFFTPLPRTLSEAEQAAQLRREMAMVVGTDDAASVRLTSDELYAESLASGQAVTWFHGLAAPEALHTRFEQIVKALPVRRYRFRLSMQAAAAVIGALADARPQHEEQEEAYTLALGWYDTHIEYTLCRGRRWQFSHHTAAASPTDGAYFALALCNRLDVAPAAIEQLYVYGQRMDPGALQPLELIFQTTPERLNPLYVVDLDPHSLDANFDAEAYVPCVGAAL